MFNLAIISFAQSVYSISESRGTLEVEITTSEPFNIDIVVHIVTNDISATGT